jgi:uncharacterized membrane protein
MGIVIYLIIGSVFMLCMDMLVTMRYDKFTHLERFMGIIFWPLFMITFLYHLYNEFKNKRDGKGK